MSCERNATKTLAAGQRSGLSRLSHKAGSVVGRLATSLSRTTAEIKAGISQSISHAVDGVAERLDAVNTTVSRPLSGLNNRLLETVDRPATLAASAAPYALAGAALLQGGLYAGLRGGAPAVGGILLPRSPSQMLANVKGLAEARRLVGMLGHTRFAANALASAAREHSNQPGLREYELKQGDKVVNTVKLWKSPRLTAVLNRFDLAGSHFLGRGLVSSQGDLFQAKKGGVWHRGASVINTPNGRRTLTHVQSLGLPTQHYYFERRLSDTQIANLAAGQVKAQQLPGYVGTISANESLAPTWAWTKRSLITARLYHPPSPGSSPQWQKRATTSPPAGLVERLAKKESAPGGTT